MEVFRRIASEVRPLPAILMSGGASPEEARQALELGIVQFLQKPLDLDVLRRAEHFVELGPGAGHAGGHVVFQGPLSELLAGGDTITARYLRGDIDPAPDVDTAADALPFSRRRGRS